MRCNSRARTHAERAVRTRCGHTQGGHDGSRARSAAARQKTRALSFALGSESNSQRRRTACTAMRACHVRARLPRSERMPLHRTPPYEGQRAQGDALLCNTRMQDRIRRTRPHTRAGASGRRLKHKHTGTVGEAAPVTTAQQQPAAATHQRTRTPCSKQRNPPPSAGRNARAQTAKGCWQAQMQPACSSDSSTRT